MAGNLSGGSLRGFEFDSSDQVCYCLMDNNASYTGSCAFNQFFNWFSGVGPVAGSETCLIQWPMDLNATKSRPKASEGTTWLDDDDWRWDNDN